MMDVTVIMTVCFYSLFGSAWFSALKSLLRKASSAEVCDATAA